MGPGGLVVFKPVFRFLHSAKADAAKIDAAKLATPDEARASVLQEAQILLAILGYDPGPVDGRGSPQTREAIEMFERDRGLAITGVADDVLLDHLRQAMVDGSFVPTQVHDLAGNAFGH